MPTLILVLRAASYYEWLARGLVGEQPYSKFAELVQSARARGLVTLVESIITDKDWRAKAGYLERTWPEAFGPVAHRVIVKEVAQAPPPEPIITVKHVRVDEKERRLSSERPLEGPCRRAVPQSRYAREFGSPTNC
jgi:hypothetical protein